MFSRQGWLAAFLFGLAACQKEPFAVLPPVPVPEDQVVLRVNGEPLGLEELDNEFRLATIHYAAVSEKHLVPLRRRITDQLVVQRLVAQEALRLKLGVPKKDLEEAWGEWLAHWEAGGGLERFPAIRLEIQKAKLWRQLLADVYMEKVLKPEIHISKSECEEYYWSHLEEFQEPRRWRVLHLVVEKDGEMKEVLERLAQGEDFANVVRGFSKGLDRDRGGDRGLLPEDAFLPSFREELERLKPGEISRPVRDAYGRHLFKLLETSPARMQTFEEAYDKILEKLRKMELENRFAEAVGVLQEAARVEINPAFSAYAGYEKETKE